MTLEIITPGKQIFTGEVSSVRFPGTSGEFEVQNNHAPIISTLTTGEIVTKLDAIESQEQSVVDTSGIESKIAVLEEKVAKLESVDTTHDHPVDHAHTKPLVNAKEIELLKVQIEEIKVSTSNPLAN